MQHAAKGTSLAFGQKQRGTGLLTGTRAVCDYFRIVNLALNEKLAGFRVEMNLGCVLARARDRDVDIVSLSCVVDINGRQERIGIDGKR